VLGATPTKWPEDRSTQPHFWRNFQSSRLDAPSRELPAVQPKIRAGRQLARELFSTSFLLSQAVISSRRM
jgi:hypothetical protein